jgi:Type I phosphodiesterase / nucleotide pyrophosphatase
MSPERSVIVLEFNELSPRLIAQFMDAGALPNFQRLHREACTYVTDAEEEAPCLEPWIQWITVHTGLSYGEHGVFDLGDGHKLAAPRVWDLASAFDRRVLVCGSMNIGYRQPINGVVLPDPWSVGIAPQPAELRPYYDFVRRMVHEYTRGDVPVSASEQARFLTFMLTHGLSTGTVRAIAAQLVAERRGTSRWKRVTILDRLQWDLFRWYYRRERPQLATFFINSTAHLQHAYWRNMDPAAFTIKPSAGEQAEYSSAVLYGYQQMDRLVGDSLQLAGPNTTVVLCTALSQQPCLTYEAIGGKTFYKPCDADRLFRFAGVTHRYQYAPLMSEEFHVYVDSEEAARDTVARLTGLRVDGRPVIRARSSGRDVFGGCGIFEPVSGAARLEVPGTDRTARFLDLFYGVDTKKSGMHHPDGLLWIRTPSRRHVVRAEHVPLRAVAPTILGLLGLPKPASMSGQPLPEVEVTVGAARMAEAAV